MRREEGVREAVFMVDVVGGVVGKGGRGGQVG